MQAISKNVCNVCNVCKGFVGVSIVYTSDMENCLQIIWQSVYDYSQHNQYDEAFIICS